jgi:C4-dicarboxylate-specific signal transduction histidine kinase
VPATWTRWFVKRQKIAATALRQARDELESKVQERQAELARPSGMRSIGEMGVSVARESVAAGNSGTCNGAAGRIIGESTRAGEIVRRIRTLSGKAATRKAPVDLSKLVADAASLLERERTRHAIAQTTDLASGLPAVKGDRVQLQQVIFNLTVNAIEAMKSRTGGPREMRIRTRH